MRLPISLSGRRRLVALASAGALVVGGAVVATPTPAHAQTACEVNFSVNEWNDGNGGFTANIDIINLGAQISGWTLAFTLPGSAQVNDGWSATWSQSGQNVTADDLGWNADLGTTQVGFNGTGFAGAPNEFTLNGVVCDGTGGGGGDPEVQASPSSLNIEEGDSASVNISLSEAPGSTVSVSLAASGTISVTPTTVTLDDGTFNTGENVTVSGDAEGSGTVTASAPDHDPATVDVTVVEEGGGGGPTDRVDNPFVGADVYVNEDWSEAAETGGAPASIYDQPTAVWLDRIAAIDEGSAGDNTTSLDDHLQAAEDLDDANGDTPTVFQVVIYNLPGRDCAALASNGELGPDDLDVYEEDYIDEITSIMADYPDLRIVATVEIDSLPNLITNVGDVGPEEPATELCNEMLDNGNYVEGIGYALAELGALGNVYSYIDIAHHGWLGWDDNFEPFADMAMDAANANGATPDDVHGFVSNVANYGATIEPFFDLGDNVGGMPIREVPNDPDGGWIDFNNYIDELSFVQAYKDLFESPAFFGPDRHVSMLIDTSRNGWGGPERPTGTSTSTDPVTYMDESRVDRRLHLGNWCNQAGAGIGEAPTPNPETGIDAYVWIKPPGESDGADRDIPNDEGKSFDEMCDPEYEGNARNQFNMSGALPDSELSGHWFQAQFDELLANAEPPLSAR